MCRDCCWGAALKNIGSNEVESHATATVALGISIWKSPTVTGHVLIPDSDTNTLLFNNMTVALTPAPAQNGFKKDLSQYSARLSSSGPYSDNLNVDVLVVGGGFGGTYTLYQMRKEGYKTVLFDAGTEFGGVWHFNSYP